MAQHYETGSKQSRLQRLRDFINRHRIATMCICGVILIAIGGAVAFVLTYRAPVADTTYHAPAKKAPKTAEKYYSHLNGIEVASKANLSKPVTAIMIENSPDARPHSGLKQAEVVYEAIAEGGITRFLTLFQQHKPQLIGPVRSLRMYYVDWLAPYQASVAHVGGSHASLQEVRNGKYRDIDQFFNGSSYWRATLAKVINHRNSPASLALTARPATNQTPSVSTSISLAVGIIRTMIMTRLATPIYAVSAGKPATTVKRVG